MKKSGFNAIRCAHNPPSPAFLDAADRLGVLVIDEAFDMWRDGKNPYDYHLYFNKWWRKDIKNMVRRDQNHPSVIMWSIGNEIPNIDKKRVVETSRKLTGYVHKLDSSRPVTSAVNSFGKATGKLDPFYSTLDIGGYNYALNRYVVDHQRKPERVMVSTESFPLEAFDYWMAVKDHPWVIGDFVWTAIDYLGEASIGWRAYPQSQDFYPWNQAYCGDIDVCGWKRPQSFYRDALWKKNQIALFVKSPHPSFNSNPENSKYAKYLKWNWHDVVPDWNWPNQIGTPLEVSIYSSCGQVELFLNGKSLGKKPTNRSTRFTAKWDVPYQPGELKAVGYTNSKKVASSILRTAGNPSQIRLSADRKNIKANGQDLSYVTVEVFDNKGVKNPKANNLIHFSIKGPGKIVGVGNANPKSTESHLLPQRKAWRGRCLVIIKSDEEPGDITLTATSKGIASSNLTITSK